MTNRLEFSGVSRWFGDFRALDKLSFSLSAGEVVGILGHNGAGKTTSMKLALGILEPSSGQVEVLGESPRGHSSEQRRRSIGYLPENVSFYQQLTGREVLQYFARLKGEDIKYVSALLNQVGLTEAADRRIKNYSKGMRQRIGLAQALLGQPRLLLLDEPTAGLDPQATREFYELVDKLRADGVSILISSHVLPGVERHIDRAIIMGRGQLRAQGSLDELRLQARLPLTIVVRTARPPHGFPDAKITALGYRVTSREDEAIKLEGPPDNKMSVMRLLVAMPEILDLDINQPTLDHLYAYFNASLDRQTVETGKPPEESLS